MLFSSLRRRDGFTEIRNHEVNARNDPPSSSQRWLYLVAMTLMVAVAVVTLYSSSAGTHSPFEEQTAAASLWESDLHSQEPQQVIEDVIQANAAAAQQRIEQCQNIDWQMACEQLGAAGARRLQTTENDDDTILPLENDLLDSDDPSVTYDNHCLHVYRLDLQGNLTFPYHANQLLRAGGNQTMALFIQHGAMRDADTYFCSFRKLMLEQTYRPFDNVLVIAPDFIKRIKVYFRQMPFGTLPSHGVTGVWEPSRIQSVAMA